MGTEELAVGELGPRRRVSSGDVLLIQTAKHITWIHGPSYPISSRVS